MAKKHAPPPGAPAVGASLGELLRQRGVHVGEAPPAAPPAAAPPSAVVAEVDLAACGKLVVRRERKGHGGKTVTIIDGLALPAAALDAVARALRIAFGCGSRVDNGRVVLQGERGEPVAAWLRARGGRRVVLGN
jgi:translation initiation factor 1